MNQKTLRRIVSGRASLLTSRNGWTTIFFPDGNRIRLETDAFRGELHEYNDQVAVIAPVVRNVAYSGHTLRLGLARDVYEFEFLIPGWGAGWVRGYWERLPE